MRKIASFFVLGLLALQGLAAQGFECTSPPTNKSGLTDAHHFVNNGGLVSSPVFERKYVRINIHYILETDGSGNFTETGDNLGNNYTGYDYANAVVRWMNWRLETDPNPVLSLPTGGHSIPNYPHEYRFLLDGVYFHRNSSQNVFPVGSTIHINLRERQDSVINVYLTNAIDTSQENNGGGRAFSLSNSTAYKATVCNGRYEKYKNWVQGGSINPLFWHLRDHAHVIHHELGHLLGLSHTVKRNDAIPCPLSSTSICGDACADTQSSWDAYQDNGVNPGVSSPASTAPCPWQVEPVNTGCSNNLMDYSGNHALSPCQLQIIHHFLNTGMSSYTSCKGVAEDRTICELGYPIIANFGKVLTLSPCAAPALVLEGESKSELYFSEAVLVTGAFVVKDNAELTIISHEACP